MSRHPRSLRCLAKFIEDDICKGRKVVPLDCLDLHRIMSRFVRIHYNINIGSDIFIDVFYATPFSLVTHDCWKDGYICAALIISSNEKNIHKHFVTLSEERARDNLVEADNEYCPTDTDYLKAKSFTQCTYVVDVFGLIQTKELRSIK